MEKVKHKLDHLGGTLDPHACFLLHRGMKKLALRVRYQNESALKLARFFERHPSVAKVNYPGLESHPHHARAAAIRRLRRDAELRAARRRGRGGALLPADGAGHRGAQPRGVETLVTRPATTSHAGLSPEERMRSGISDGLIRVSTGIEATEDLIDDFNAALS